MACNADPLLEIYLSETGCQLDRLEEIALEALDAGALPSDGVNEIFRIVHTIKSSSAMMACDNVSSLAHAVEDLFQYLREGKRGVAPLENVAGYVLRASNFIRSETAKVARGRKAGGDSRGLAGEIREFVRTFQAGGAATGTYRREHAAPIQDRWAGKRSARQAWTRTGAVKLGDVFGRMVRLVRDMGRRLGMEAELSITGGETVVDGSIADSLSAPLMHLIRNAMDHGLERPDERRALGKPAKGRIRLDAVKGESELIVTVSDDGRGLDRERILAKAREKGLLAKPEGEMACGDICALLLLPGFSTKDEVTEFSGRGVGLDVVRQNVEKAGGRVSIDAEPGRGTTVTIRIPLSRHL